MAVASVKTSNRALIALDWLEMVSDAQYRSPQWTLEKDDEELDNRTISRASVL